MLIHLICLSASLYVTTVYGISNVTIDDQDSSIIYSPAASWAKSAPSTLDIGGLHMLTQDPTATATFTFTGVMIYFLSPRWPYLVNTAISLDSAPATLVDLVDHNSPNIGQGPETVQSSVVWSSGNLTNQQHTLVISVGAGQPYAIVDALIFTTLEPSDTGGITTLPPSSVASTSSTVPSSITSTSGRTIASTTSVPVSAAAKPRVLPVALGTVLGLFGLLILALIVWFFCRRRSRPVSEAWTVEGSTAPHTPRTGSAFDPPSPYMTQYTQRQDAHNSNYYPSMPGGSTSLWQDSRQQYQNPAFAYPQVHRNVGGHTRHARGQSNSWSSAGNNHASNRYTTATSNLSTITETSTPTMGDGKTPLASSPASRQSDIGYQTSSPGGSDRLPSIPSDSRPTSSYQPYPNVSNEYGGGARECTLDSKNTHGMYSRF